VTSSGGINPGILFVPGIMVFGFGSMYRLWTRRAPPATGGAYFQAERRLARPLQWIGGLFLVAGMVWLLVDVIN
jgi:hypothetical protein